MTEKLQAPLMAIGEALTMIAHLPSHLENGNSDHEKLDPKMEEPEEETVEDDGELDPRIQDELEKLNKSSVQINELENQLDEIRASFRQLFSASNTKLESMARELGSCVEKSRPYYSAITARRQAQNNSMQALNRYEKACARLSGAKEMTHKAEMNARAGGPITESIQEALNHAIAKVNEAEKEKLETIREHQTAMATYMRLDQRVKEAEDGHKRDIRKARPYFVMFNRVDATMKEEKTRVQIYEEKVQICKSLYAEALGNLENISEEIHRRRKESSLRRQLGSRGQGVGAELSSPVAETGEEASQELLEVVKTRRRSNPASAAPICSEVGPSDPRRRSTPLNLGPITSDAEPVKSEARRRRSSGLATSASVTAGSQEDSFLSASRPRSSHRRSRHRQRQLRISATPLVGFLAETAHAHAREAARLQERATRHEMSVEAWSPAEDSDASSVDGEGRIQAAAQESIRHEEAAFQVWKEQTARLQDALHPYDGDDEDDVDDTGRH